jgi:transposase-like protein
MSKHRRSWSETEKATILQHYHAHGIASTSRQFEVSASMIYRWLVESKETTAKPSSNGISLADYNRLLKENQALKEIVAEKELEIRVKDALLKKTVHQSKSD